MDVAIEVDGVRTPPRKSDYNPMSDMVRLDLTDRQRELLLRGLRYVRSSRMLEIRDVPDTAADERRSELSEIRHLVEMLDDKNAVPSRAG